MSEPYHHCGGNHVEHQFLCRSGLHSRASGHKLRPDHYFYRNLGNRAEFRTAVAGDAASKQSGLPGFPDGSDDVWGTAGSSHAHHHVLRHGIVLQYIIPALLRIVLGGLHGIAYRLVPACNQADEPVPHSVSRRNLGSVQDSEPPAGPGSDIEYPAALPHPPDNSVHKPAYGVNVFRHGIGNESVLVIDAGQNLRHGHVLKVLVIG